MNTIYWLWFTLKEELSLKTRIALLEKYSNAMEIYNSSDFDDIHKLSEKAKEELLDKSLDKARTVKAKIDAMGGYIVTIEDNEYPSLLKNIYDPPYVLYMYGEHIKWDKLLTITVVGTRIPTIYGEKVTEFLSRGLAEAGATIVSGMARGIDSIAGMTAIKFGGKTVAVLGSGLDVIYPPEHADLYDKISKNGVIITEYPPGTKPSRENFPRRNRIMAGLSYGILVTQAPKKSGALITASYAVENGRDLYAVPADIFEPDSVGSNQLIRQGAKAVMSAEDIISEYPYIDIVPLSEMKREKINKEWNNTIDLSSLNELQEQIVKTLMNGALHIDEITRGTSVANFEVNSELVMLELMGIVKKLNGNIYELI